MLLRLWCILSARPAYSACVHNESVFPNINSFGTTFDALSHKSSRSCFFSKFRHPVRFGFWYRRFLHSARAQTHFRNFKRCVVTSHFFCILLSFNINKSTNINKSIQIFFHINESIQIFFHINNSIRILIQIFSPHLIMRRCFHVFLTWEYVDSNIVVQSCYASYFYVCWLKHLPVHVSSPNLGTSRCRWFCVC